MTDTFNKPACPHAGETQFRPIAWRGRDLIRIESVKPPKKGFAVGDERVLVHFRPNGIQSEQVTMVLSEFDVEQFKAALDLALDPLPLAGYNGEHKHVDY